MNFKIINCCFFHKSHVWCLHEEKYTFQLIPRQSVNLQGPRSTRFKGAIRNICATTFNQLLGLTALMLWNCCRPRSSGVNHLLCSVRRETPAFTYGFTLRSLPRWKAPVSRLTRSYCLAVSHAAPFIHNLYYLVSSAKRKRALLFCLLGSLRCFFWNISNWAN